MPSTRNLDQSLVLTMSTWYGIDSKKMAEAEIFFLTVA